jgi:hypothetical protein
MRNRRTPPLLLIVFCWIVAGLHGDARQASNAEPYVGTWSGTYDGAGAGNFELTLDKRSDGVIAGRVAVTTDGGNYDAELKGIAFEGTRMTAKYDFPLDPSSEIVMVATFDGRAAKGTWSLRPKGQDTEAAGGTWTVNKK